MGSHAGLLPGRAARQAHMTGLTQGRAHTPGIPHGTREYHTAFLCSAVAGGRLGGGGGGGGGAHYMSRAPFFFFRFFFWGGGGTK